MAIDKDITPITPLPGVTSEDRPEAVDQLVEVELPRLSEELDIMIGEINETQVEINAKSANVDAKNANVNTKAQESENAAANAESSAQRAENAVPIGDGYNQETINNLNSIQNDAKFDAYGYIEKSKLESKFVESDDPNIVKDKNGGKFRIGKGISEIESDTLINVPVCPFDPISSDILHDDRLYGLILQESKNRADIIIVGNELLQNPFVVDAGVVGINGNILTFSSSSLSQASSFIPNRTIGELYVVKYKMVSYVSGDATLFFNNSASPISLSNTVGEFSIEISNVTGDNFSIRGTGAQDFIIEIISVELKNKIYQAIKDNTGTNLLNTSDYQVLSDIDTQDVTIYRNNKITKACSYYSFRGTKSFTLEYSQDEIMEDYEYVKNNKNLYEDINYFIVPCLISKNNTKLNAGIYSAEHNSLGANTSLNVPKSIYECFSLPNNGVGTVESGESGHPSGRYYDKIYLDNLIFIGGYATTSSYDFLTRDYLSYYLNSPESLPKKVDETIIENYISYSVEDNLNNKYFPINEKAGILKINEINTNKNGASLVEDAGGQLLLQIVSDTNSTDTIDLTNATNTVVYLPFYSKD